MNDSHKLPYLDPSELGEKEYWDKAYERELENYTEDSEDEGVIWFSESRAEEKVVQFLATLPFPGPHSSNAENSQLRILDVGTGNGHQLFALKDKGWKAGMIGVDYSEASIQLAQKIQESREEEAENDNLRFEKWDILKDAISNLLQPGFDIVLDKGTFDAISLDATEVEGNRRGCEIYPEKISPIIKEGGYLIVTSCNWTAAELKKWFTLAGLSPVAIINYPSFTFGGKSGQAVSGVCFQKQREAELS